MRASTARLVGNQARDLNAIAQASALRDQLITELNRRIDAGERLTPAIDAFWGEGL